MNLIEAKLRNLDVYMFAATAPGLQAAIANNARLAHREVYEFTDQIGTTTVLCVAVGKRPNHGQTARTVKSFIREE